MMAIRIGLLVLGLTILGASEGVAQNLLLNPDFDTPLGRSSWLESGSWSSEDADGSPGSGSLQIVNSFSFASVVLARQCVPVSAGQRFALGARVRAAPGQFGGSTTAGVTVGWWTQPDCSGTVLGSSLGGLAQQDGSWETVGPATIMAPPGAAGAGVRLQVFKGDGAGSFTASFDEVFLPEPEAGSAVLAALSTLAWITHRSRPSRRSAPPRVDRSLPSAP